MTRDGTAYITTRYEKNGTRRHLAAAFVDTQDLDDVAGAISRRAAEYPQDETVYLDLYAAATAAARTSRTACARRSSARTSRCSSSAWCSTSPRPERGNSGADAITLRRTLDGGWEIDRDLQFVHPELAERLNLWRMSEFELERIPSPADVYLFRGVGRTNPKDERLFALAEVRELTIVRNKEGRVVSLPELEHMLAETLGALRRVQARRSPRERLLWNRVRLDLWPEVDLAPEEAGALIDRYARETEGLGIETVIIKGRMRDMRGGEMKERELRLFAPAGRGVHRRGRRAVRASAAAAGRGRPPDRAGAPPRLRASRRAGQGARAGADRSRARHPARRVHRARPGRGRPPGAGRPRRPP